MRGLKKPAAIFGWCTAEAEFSQFGHYQCCSTAAPNLSFHAALKPLKPPPYIQDTKPKVARPQKKVYLAFVANEGDTAVVLTQQYYGGWLDPGRGKIPLNWAIGPEYARMFPAMVEYYFRTKADKDYFVCGPSGAGYVHPDRMSPACLDAFLAHTARELREGVNLSEIILWEAQNASVWERYAQRIPGLRGLTTKPNGLYPYGGIEFTEAGGVPLLREGNLHYWHTCEKYFGPEFQLKAPAAVEFLNKVYEEQSKPHFFMVYGLQGNLPSEIVKLAAALDPTKFEIVDMGTLFHLARESAPPRWTRQMLRKTDLWSSLNGALVSLADKGLRVEVAPGKTWGIATLPNVLLPREAAAVRVRVAELSGGIWVVKLTGRFGLRTEAADWVPFDGCAGTGDFGRELDKRVRARNVLREPLEGLQMGLSGGPGAYVVFELIDFL